MKAFALVGLGLMLIIGMMSRAQSNPLEQIQPLGTALRPGNMFPLTPIALPSQEVVLQRVRIELWQDSVQVVEAQAIAAGRSWAAARLIALTQRWRILQEQQAFLVGLEELNIAIVVLERSVYQTNTLTLSVRSVDLDRIRSLTVWQSFVVLDNASPPFGVPSSLTPGLPIIVPPPRQLDSN